MIIKVKEKGQALILIALAAVGLFAFGALAIDGSRAYSDKRHAQNAADTAALAGALAYTRGGNVTTITTAAQTRATSNGYDDNGISNHVTISTTEVPSGECPGNTQGKDVTVTINSFVETSFAKVIGRRQVENAVTATSRACGFYYASLFDGNAIVGLNPSTTACAFDTGDSNSSKWKIKGGGAFSNGCAWSKNNSSVNLYGGCVTSVASASGFTCQNENQTSQAINYPADVLKIMPPNPCDGTPGDIGLPPPASGSTFSNGVYCISNMDAYDKKDITLNNATLYVTDTDFQLKFAGGGGFYGTPTHSGTYAGSDDYDDYFMIIAYDPAGPCPRFTDNNSQVIEWRGNGSGTFYGTVLAPSACLDIRGNGDPAGMHTQIIGYNVGSNGDADVLIRFEADENHQLPVYPSISVLK